MSQDKASISLLLIHQVKEFLINGSNWQKHNYNINHEIRHSINVQLLLGLILEGIINEVGENLLDKWTWQKLEGSNTPLKWKIISGLKNGFENGQEPLNTIIEIQQIRNKIAHPKSEKIEPNFIMENEFGSLYFDLKDSSELEGQTTIIHIGYKAALADFNYKKSHQYSMRSLTAIKHLKDKLELTKFYNWLDQEILEFKNINFPNRKILK